MKKYFGVFCEKGLKIDLFALNNYLPILGIARTFKIKWFWIKRKSLS